MAQRPEIEAARRRYERLLRSGHYFDDEDRTFFDEQSGGFVLVHRGHMTGIDLARRGCNLS